MIVERPMYRWIATTDLAAGPQPHHRLRGPATPARMTVPIQCMYDDKTMLRVAQQYWRYTLLQAYIRQNPAVAGRPDQEEHQ